jgi:hypothetical protein
MIQVRSLAKAIAGGGFSGVCGAEDLKGLHARAMSRDRERLSTRELLRA